MRATRTARAALLAAALLLGAAPASAYDMEAAGPAEPGAIPRTRDPALIRSVEVKIEPLYGSARPGGSSAAYQGARQPKAFESAKHAKKSGKKGKKGKSAAKKGKNAAQDPGVRQGSVTDGADPVLAKP